METSSVQLPWVVFAVDRQRYAIPCEVVREITTFESSSAVPGTPSHVRGVFNLRGQIIPLLDFRAMLGLPTNRVIAQQLSEQLLKREEDHRRWLAALETSIRENTEFTLPRDPHMCAFGKWYDHFETDDISVRGLLRELDQPHRAIHALADRALAMRDNGEHDHAIELVNSARATTLATLVLLLGDLRIALERSFVELAVVLQTEKTGSVSLVVDAVESVEMLQDRFDSVSSSLGMDSRQGVVERIGRLQRDGNSLVLVPSLDALFSPTPHADPGIASSPSGQPAP